MDKKIEDYLHLYLGCKISWINAEGKEWMNEQLTAEVLNMIIYDKLTAFKPNLRQINSMTEEEKKYIIGFLPPVSKNLLPSIKTGETTTLWLSDAVPHAIVWLLSKHFDLFGLIESGLAIDKTTLNQPK